LLQNSVRVASNMEGSLVTLQGGGVSELQLAITVTGSLVGLSGLVLLVMRGMITGLKELFNEKLAAIEVKLSSLKESVDKVDGALSDHERRIRDLEKGPRE
jgi:hypothetical protein